MKKDNHKLHLEAFNTSKARKNDKSEIVILKSSVKTVRKERNVLKNKIKDLEIEIENLINNHQSCVTNLQSKIDTYKSKARYNEKEIHNLHELLNTETEKNQQEY